MKTLIIYAHPNPKSFNHAIKECVETYLKQNKKDFEVRDLYGLKFNPVLGAEDFSLMAQGQLSEDLKKEQDYIKNADTLVFIYPIWWFGMPALLKGYIERVFSHGFAYAYTGQGIQGLLKDKKVLIFNTTGGPQENYSKFGFDRALETTTKAGLFEFCGISVVAHKYFFAVPSISPEARGKMLQEAAQLCANLL